MAQRDFSYGMGELVDATKSAGATLGGILRDRINKKEYDDFLAGPNKELSQQLRQANDLMLDEDNPDAAGQALRMTNGAMMTYLDEAAKYPDNPLVNQRAKQTFDVHMNMMKQEFVLAHQKAMDQRANTKLASDIQTSQVKQVGTLAEADKNEALAGKYGAEGMAKEAQASPFFSGPPGTIKGANEDQLAENLWNAISARGSRPQSPEEQKSVDLQKQDIRMAEAQKRIYELAGRQEIREVPSKLPGGLPDRHVYNPHSKADLDAVAQTIDPAVIDAKWTMGVAQREGAAYKLDPSVFEKRYGVLTDPTKASTFDPITKPVNESTVGKIVLGIGGWGQLGDPETRAEPKTMEDAIKRLPPSIDRLSGPLADLFRQMPTVARDENIKTVADLKMQLWQHGKEVIDNTFGGGAAYGSLDEGVKRNRQTAANLLQAMTDKYGDEIAVKMGIAKAKPVAPVRKGLTDSEVSSIPGLDSILKDAGRAKKWVGGIINRYEQ